MPLICSDRRKDRKAGILFRGNVRGRVCPPHARDEVGHFVYVVRRENGGQEALRQIRPAFYPAGYRDTPAQAAEPAGFFPGFRKGNVTLFGNRIGKRITVVHGLHLSFLTHAEEQLPGLLFCVTELMSFQCPIAEPY